MGDGKIIFMKSPEIRKTFLEYFKAKGHEVVGSSPLIPRGDPTLLFTNAGMVQFKSVFLGDEKRPYKRAVSCQKCLRAGGKHSDIENVGHTRRHHTFFEMLGNFSFGDYFKKEAIIYSWQLLTEVFNLPNDKLWVSIYEEDDESERLWHEETGLPISRIVRLGAKDNFWQMADVGPCGPCSELIIDQGPELSCGKDDCGVGCECDRFLELWNLVFMQFNRDEKGNLIPLPRPSVDTGMGIERLSAILQGKTSNFDSDLFSEIRASIEVNTGSKYGETQETDVSIRIIADHIRAIAFLSSEGIMPSNEGRGYVLRRIIRRAVRHLMLLGIEGPMLYSLIDSVISTMGSSYPELINERERIIKVLRFEEERFSRTLEIGMHILDELIGRLKASNGKVIAGSEVFRLYDTYGFPVDLVRDIAIDSGLTLDEEGFHKEMDAQRQRARASWVGEETSIAGEYQEILTQIGKTQFIGYETTSSDAVLKAVLKAGVVVTELREGEEAEVFLDKTPFYGESGGQVGDTGRMHTESLMVDVLDTKKPLEGVISHIIKVRAGRLQSGMNLTCEVNLQRRKAIMRNHTATHLLQGALRAILGEHVKQAGSLVAPDRLRFDFTHFTGLTRDELTAIEEMVNEKIMEDLPLRADDMSIETAVSSGAIALFGEKYGERVRVISIGDFSKELCGGTHVKATGNIGLFKLLYEGSSAGGIRRIEAITGLDAISYMRAREIELREIATLLKTSEPLAEKVRLLIEELKQLQKEKEKLKGKATEDISATIAMKVVVIEGIKIISEKVEGLKQKDLRILADNIRDRIGSGVIILASVVGKEASFVGMVTKDLKHRFSADKILKEVADMTGGKAGGRAELAQGGTKDISRLNEALKNVYRMFRKAEIPK